MTMTTAKKGKKKKGGNTGRWDPFHLVTIYRTARLGLSYKEVAQALGVNRNTLLEWRRDRPEVEKAFAAAEREFESGEPFSAFVYKRLPPELQAVWDSIKKLQKAKDGRTRIEVILQDHGKKVRQQLFLHALCEGRFSPSFAMRAVCVSKAEVDSWLREDPEFALLAEEIQFHKKNLFEETLVRLVEEGVPAAVIHANKTLNSDRGYSPRSDVNLNVSGAVAVGVLDLSELMPYLSEAARLELLGAVRRREAALAEKSLPPTPEVVISGQIAGAGASESAPAIGERT